jgi:nucleotide-binding universal stress UspA family protein
LRFLWATRRAKVYDRILVPLDGSESAEIVLPYVEEITVKFGSEITLASVADPASVDTKHLYRTYLGHAVEIVERELKDWGAGEGVVVRNELLSGKPAATIIDYATKHDMSLIAMSSHGSSGRGAWLLGSVAAKILQATDIPVLLVRTAAKAEAIRERQLLSTILLPLDGSKLGESAVPQASALARELGAKLILLQVIEFFSAGGRAAQYVMPGEESKRAALGYLNGVGERLKEIGLDASSVVLTGTPAPEIIQYAAANNIGLIALSAHGESGVTHWVFGSVTDKVLHAGDTPVLLVRRTKKA